jgi:dihydroorotase
VIRLGQAPLEQARIVIRGARLYDPVEGLDVTADLLVADGVIAQIGDRIDAPEGTREVRATGRIVLPGLIDPHVHLRVPGQEYKEDIASGTRAAAAGGYTTVLSMPNTDPVIDTASVFEAALATAEAEAVVPTGFLAAISIGRAGDQLVEMRELAACGVAGFTDDGSPVTSPRLMRRALQYARPLGLPLALHEEESSLTEGGQMHEGAVSARLGLGAWPGVAETLMVARDCRLAELEGGRIHLQHLSIAGSVEEVAWARERGVRVSAEASPHHLTLTDEAVLSLDSRFKMNPPLASEADRLALIEGLRSGVIDCIATDHAPHAQHEKEVPFEAAAFGVTGLETALPVLLEELVAPGIVDLGTILRAMTEGPANAFDLERPSLRVGAPANLALWDIDALWTMGGRPVMSKASNSCFAGRPMRGVCLMTIAAGRIAHETDGERGVVRV